MEGHLEDILQSFLNIWALQKPTGEIHRVTFVDGIYLDRKTVILIARSEQYILSWYLARAETSIRMESFA